MNEQILKNIFDQAKLAISNDARTKLYNSMQMRTNAFRQINQKANARHALFSGAPAAQMMQHDSTTTMPNGVRLVLDATQRMQQNQEMWDKQMEFIKDMNKQAEELEKAIK